MVDCSFSSDGGASITRWTTKSPEKQEGTDTRWEDGKQYEAQCEAVKEGRNRWTFISTTAEGKPIKMVYDRIDDLEGSSDDSMWQDYRDRLAGSWDGTGTIGSDLEEFGLKRGDRFVFHIDWSPEADGRALTGIGKFSVPSRDHTADVRLLSGWDPEKQQIRLLALWSGGLLEEIALNRGEGDSFFGVYAATFPGRETSRQAIRCTFTDADTEEMIFLDGPRKGEALSTWKRTQ
jgi:hypothetical protein